MAHQRNPADRSLIALDRWTWSTRRKAILRRDRWQCQLCGIAIRPAIGPSDTAPEVAEVHHLVSRARGGSDRPENLAAACRACNRKAAAAERREERELWARRTGPGLGPVLRRGRTMTSEGRRGVALAAGHSTPPKRTGGLGPLLVRGPRG